MGRYETAEEVDGITVRLILDEVDGRAEIVEVTVTAPGGLRTEALRRLPLTRLRLRALARLARFRPLLAGTRAEEPAGRLAAAPARRGRPTVNGPDHFTAVADVYREALASGRDDPTRAVAETYQVAHSTAAAWVGRSRRDGHLHPTRRGQPGG